METGTESGVCKQRREHQPLTLEQLRTYPGYENMPEDRLAEELESIRKMADLLAGFMADCKIYSIDNQQVVYLNNTNHKAA
jgi:hypothetical protein